MKRTVLYAIDTLEVGGAERSMLEIAARLNSFYPVFCVLYEGLSLLRDYSFNDDQVIKFELKGSYDFLKAVLKFDRLLDQVKPDLVVATLLRSEIVARYCCHKKGIPIIGTFVNDTYDAKDLRQLSLLMRLKILFFKQINAYTAKWCLGFISNSEAIKYSNSRALGVPIEKIVVIPRGRRAPDVFPLIEKPRNVSFIFGNVGRLIRRKGQLDLLKAFSICLGGQNALELHIVGSGTYGSELQAFVSNNSLSNSVSFLGTISDVDAFYRGCNAAVFASHYEGFSGAVLEAVFAGVPIIASDIPMNRELLPEDGALFFPVGDTKSLAQCMLEVVNNYELAVQRAVNAFSYAVDRFGIDAVVAQHEAYYQVVVKTDS